MNEQSCISIREAVEGGEKEYFHGGETAEGGEALSGSESSLEIWKEIPGYEGRYSVSNKGRVMSLQARYGRRRNYIRAIFRNRAGYQNLTLTGANGKKCTKSVAPMVAALFLEKPDGDGYEVNHKNAIKHDDRVENLEWVTHAQNVDHAMRLKLRKPPVGEGCGNAVLTDGIVRMIRANCGPGKMGYSQMARSLGVSTNAVRMAALGLQWRHVK